MSNGEKQQDNKLFDSIEQLVLKHYTNVLLIVNLPFLQVRFRHRINARPSLRAMVRTN